ncbi:OB-fold nucleic acid binding domain-containing protein, partial [Finegoldia magna]
MNSMGNLRRTHMCGELRLSDVNKEVILMGWVQKERNLGSLIFIDLRDNTGITQIAIKDDNKEIFDKAKDVKSEYVLCVKGDV